MRVLAALSGGVDSAVAAAMAVEAGHDVTGIHMALSSEPQQCRVGSRGCCSVEDAQDAARASEIIGIPFYVWDLSEHFERTVVDDFLTQYQKGNTPNPCIRCNEFVKFRELAERARALGFDAVCTGHYARVVSEGDEPYLLRGLDEAKDQSYVLAVMGKDELSRTLLPLGEAPSKAWVREEALRRGLGVSNKPDSFDICFIPDGDTQGFLRRNLGAKTGEILDPDGNILGTHEGYYQFTVGQRKGLQLGRPAADGKPRYVLETRPKTNQVIVGAQELLNVDTIEAEDIVWMGDPSLAVVNQAATDSYGDEVCGSLNAVPSEVVTAQMRAHGTPSVVTNVTVDQGRVVVSLAASVRGIAAGQSLVLYRGSKVVLQATIAGTIRK